jgi:hypothetical protein
MSKIIYLPIVFSVLFLSSLIADTAEANGSHSDSTEKKEMHKMEEMGHETMEHKMEHDMDSMEHQMMDHSHGDVGPCSGGRHSGMDMMEPLKKGPDFNEGKVQIISPKDGDTINKSSVRVKFNLIDKGSAGQHLHIFLDGACKKMIMGGKTHILANLSEGEHTIDIRIMTKHHKETGAKDSVKVTVVNQ